jgi:hypothetical protein
MNATRCLICRRVVTEDNSTRYGWGEAICDTCWDKNFDAVSVGDYSLSHKGY